MRDGAGRTGELRLRMVVWSLAYGLFLAVAHGCSGSADSPPGLPGPSLTLHCTTDPAPLPDRVGLECPASSEAVLPVRVAIGGPSTSADIYGIKFDLLFDSAFLHYDGHSLTGSFLGKEGGSVLALASVEDDDPDRLVVAVSLQGAVSGVQVTDSVELVAAFFFRGVQAGASTVRFENGEVVDSGLNPIAGVSVAGEIDVVVP